MCNIYDAFCDDAQDRSVVRQCHWLSLQNTLRQFFLHKLAHVRTLLELKAHSYYSERDVTFIEFIGNPTYYLHQSDSSSDKDQRKKSLWL